MPGKQKQKPVRPHPRLAKRTSEASELASLADRTVDPTIYTKDVHCKLFSQLPLSRCTMKGLEGAHYVEMTDIQRAGLPLALCRRDVLGAARTGSGKTLAFLIPVLERLYREQWTQMDGLGALIISPTRELALQIFEVLRKIGKHHSLSAGLLIGGKDLKSEQERVCRMNILVCTPGRLLQHMDQTPGFTCDNLQVLVLDEADRILDCGFEASLNAIIENLPTSRQTLLFSATQTKSVKDLARLSLRDPEYVAVHEQADTSTPSKLLQHYTVIPLENKLEVLFSFIKTHLKQKTIVFLSSCKQVRFVHEAFCKMQPGVPLLCLHGKQKQMRRMAVFEQFCRKKAVCLFATDVAARGLDFPAVDWVYQADCPEDVDTYIHRVGRTARYDSEGHALLTLLPSETVFLERLEAKKVPVASIKINPSKTQSITGSLQSLCMNPELKYLARKALISYARSVFLQKDKKVFDVTKLDLEAYAESLGLPGAVNIQFTKGAKKAKNAPRIQDEPVGDVSMTESDASDSDDPGTAEPVKVKTRVDKMFAKKNNTILSEHYAKLTNDGPEDTQDPDDDFLTLKRVNHDVDESSPLQDPKDLSKRQLRKLKQKAIKSLGKGQKFAFDDDGNPVSEYQLESIESFEKNHSVADLAKSFLNDQTEQMKQVDVHDRSMEKERIKLAKRERKRKEKQARGDLHEEDDDEEGVQVTLGSPQQDFDSASDLGHHSDASVEDEPRSHAKRIKLDELESQDLEQLALSLL